jgi:3-oxoacyl-[acyl-carrier-protein] synthase-3
MACFSIKGASIRGISACVPLNTESNYDLKIIDAEERKKFIASTGVIQRRIATKNITTSDLCYRAAQTLLLDLSWAKEEIDCLVFVTQTPDYILPATSCLLQHRLGLRDECFVLDISLGCSGWVYGLSVIAGMMNSAGFKKGLLLVGDTISKLVSERDKSTMPLFGDAGTATALEIDATKEGFIFHVAVDGDGGDTIIVPDGGFRNQASDSSFIYKKFDEGIERNNLHLVLNGMDVFSFGINKAPESINRLLEYATIDSENVDLFIFHQANLFMNEKIRKKLGLPSEKVPYSLGDYGNTSSASIPLTIVAQNKTALDMQKLRCVACGFGVGLSWASVYFVLDHIVCSTIEEI